MVKDYTIGIYIRLSMADEDTGNGSKAESDSIGNQRMLINRYLDNHPTLSKYPRLEFADDGYTGTNFHRPQFAAMMEKVRHGEINLICVKDFSRFSRDYIETGNYLECTFPFMGVRFISINDGYDSDDYKGTTGGLEVVMRSIIYAAYSKDLSVKTTTAKIQMMKQGKYVGGYAPYGYVLHPEIRNKLKLDPEAAEVVRHIFQLANDGKSPRAIAEILSEEKVLIPSAYEKENHPEQYNGQQFEDPYIWSVSTVRTILNRQEYIGHTVLHKSTVKDFKNHKRQETGADEHYVFPNTHEPIISQELWDSVQKQRKRVQRASAWGSHSHRLSGYLYCADCGRRMTLQTHYSKTDGSVQYSFRCGGYSRMTDSCTAHGISAGQVETLIATTIKRITHRVLNDEQAFAEEIQSRWNAQQESKPQQKKSDIKQLQKRYGELSDLVRSLYENYVSGILPERQYRQLMKQYDDEQAAIEVKISELEERISEESKEQLKIDQFTALVHKYQESDEVSDAMFREMIDKIIVHEAEGVGNARTQQVDIYFNYAGQIDIAYTEEELAQMKEQEERVQAERIAKEKARSKAYREKRKAQKIAENGGEIVKKKVCPHCGKEYVPESNRQIFCSQDCRKAAHQAEKQKQREAERGDHYYHQRTCAVCGKLYWPTHSQQKFCSEDCQRINHNKVTLEFYHRRREQEASA